MITQGDQGEMLALGWLGLRYPVAVPLGRSPDYDVIAEIDGKLARVQVKTCARRSPERYDYLYVHTGPGRGWFIPSSVIEGTIVIILGGPKYAEYEVDPGPPLTLS